MNPNESERIGMNCNDESERIVQINERIEMIPIRSLQLLDCSGLTEFRYHHNAEFKPDGSLPLHSSKECVYLQRIQFAIIYLSIHIATTTLESYILKVERGKG